jgi:hypothetical protein
VVCDRKSEGCGLESNSEKNGSSTGNVQEALLLMQCEHLGFSSPHCCSRRQTIILVVCVSNRIEKNESNEDKGKPREEVVKA